MAETPPNDGQLWKPGECPNKRGRPLGSKNRKTILREELEKHGGELAAVLKAKALAGDPTCLGLWLARLDPPLRPRGETVEFSLDVNAPLATQIAQVIQAVSAGELTVDEGRQIADMIRQLADVRALEGGGDKVERLVLAFRDMAKSIAVVEGVAAPYSPPNGDTES